MYSFELELVEKKWGSAKKAEDGIDDTKDPSPTDEGVDKSHDDVEGGWLLNNSGPTDDEFNDPTDEW